MSIRIVKIPPPTLPPVTIADLEAYFHRSAVPSENQRVGAEFEKLAVWRSSGLQVPYEGEDGIRQILGRLADQFGWNGHFEADNMVALERDGTVISFEPGGQVEMASPPCKDLSDIERALLSHREELRQVVDPTRIAWLATGFTPYSRVPDIQLVPRERYRIMAHYMEKRSAFAHHMMRGTASIQASYDFSSEQDAVDKFVLAISLSPFVSAIFANSPIAAGASTGDISYRGRIWYGMDPDRSGLLSDVVRADAFSFERWVDHLLDVPMMFYCINDEFTPANGRSFRDFMDHGLEGYFPTLYDWEMHLTSIFPEVRLKKYIEVRGADAAPPALALGFVALWKGLFYDKRSLEDGLELANEIPYQDRGFLFYQYFTRGLSGAYKGRAFNAWAREIVALAAEGLERQANVLGIRNERAFLDPVLEVLDRGESPGSRLVAAWPTIRQSPSEVVSFLEY